MLNQIYYTFSLVSLLINHKRFIHMNEFYIPITISNVNN